MVEKEGNSSLFNVKSNHAQWPLEFCLSSYFLSDPLELVRAPLPVPSQRRAAAALTGVTARSSSLPDHDPFAFCYLSGLLDPLLSPPSSRPRPSSPSRAFLSETPARPAPPPPPRSPPAAARFDGPGGQLVAGDSSRLLSLPVGFRVDRDDLEVLRLLTLQELEQGKVLDPAQYLVGDGGSVQRHAVGNVLLGGAAESIGSIATMSDWRTPA
jgi:hypothetical protein